MKHWLLVFTLLLGGQRLNAEEFVRYQIIIDKSPFGSVAAAGATAVVKDWAQKYQLVALVTSNAGQGVVQVGIFDKEANRSYYRAEGEILENGVKIAKITQDPRQVQVTIQLGLDKALLTFQERSTAPVVAAQPPRPGFQPGVPPGAAPGTQPTTTPMVRRIPFRRSN